MANYQQYNKTAKSNNNKGLIIAVTLIILALILGATLLFMMAGDDDSSADVNTLVEDTQQTNDTATETETTTATATPGSNDLKIIRGSFNTASPLPAKTYITVYVGEEHSGEKVKIRALYTHDGSQLNQEMLCQKLLTVMVSLL